MRCFDGDWTTAGGANLGVGIAPTGITDFPGFQWNKVMPLNSGGGRFSVDYTRIGAFTAGQTLRLYVYQDSGASQDIYSAAMQIWRIA